MLFIKGDNDLSLIWRDLIAQTASFPSFLCVVSHSDGGRHLAFSAFLAAMEYLYDEFSREIQALIRAFSEDPRVSSWMAPPTEAGVRERMHLAFMGTLLEDYAGRHHVIEFDRVLRVHNDSMKIYVRQLGTSQSHLRDALWFAENIAFYLAGLLANDAEGSKVGNQAGDLRLADGRLSRLSPAGGREGRLVLTTVGDGPGSAVDVADALAAVSTTLDEYVHFARIEPIYGSEAEQRAAETMEAALAAQGEAARRGVAALAALHGLGDASPTSLGALNFARLVGATAAGLAGLGQHRGLLERLLFEPFLGDDDAVPEAAALVEAAGSLPASVLALLGALSADVCAAARARLAQAVESGGFEAVGDEAACRAVSVAWYAAQLAFGATEDEDDEDGDDAHVDKRARAQSGADGDDAARGQPPPPPPPSTDAQPRGGNRPPQPSPFALRMFASPVAPPQPPGLTIGTPPLGDVRASLPAGWPPGFSPTQPAQPTQPTQPSHIRKGCIGTKSVLAAAATCTVAVSTFAS